jgi:hypothetical protein
MRQSGPGRFLFLLMPCIGCFFACQADKPSTKTSPQATKPPTTATAASPTPAAPAATPAAPSCPTGMREVLGSYCTELQHLCVKGHDVNVEKIILEDGTKKNIVHVIETNCPDGCAVPKYCDEFKKGYAVCTGKERPEHFCIDKYEYPNREGELPQVMTTWTRAKAACESEGKRLCGDDEWTLACEGPERLPYPTGWSRDNKACNIDVFTPKPNEGLLFSTNKAVSDAEFRRLDHRTPSGSHPRCTSPFGVDDTIGNTDEWTENRTQPGASYTQSPYVSVLKGGHWVANFPRNRCRPSTPGHAPYFYSYAQGFRCCANPK